MRTNPCGKLNLLSQGGTDSHFAPVPPRSPTSFAFGPHDYLGARFKKRFDWVSGQPRRVVKSRLEEICLGMNDEDEAKAMMNSEDDFPQEESQEVVESTVKGKPRQELMGDERNDKVWGMDGEEVEGKWEGEVLMSELSDIERDGDLEDEEVPYINRDAALYPDFDFHAGEEDAITLLLINDSQNSADAHHLRRDFNPAGGTLDPTSQLELMQKVAEAARANAYRQAVVVVPASRI
ncbi:hypothetical protein P7C70_g2549, partial [Phenoliferia sp. Uapishka_3]